MVSNDDRGQQVIEACQVGGIYIPEGIAVVGVDNDGILCGLTNPPLENRAAFQAIEKRFQTYQLWPGGVATSHRSLSGADNQVTN